MCAFEDCSKKVRSRGFCQTHYERLRLSGELPPSRKVTRQYSSSDSVSYQRAHERVKEHKGGASDHACVSCGSQAKEWAYTYGCPKELPSKFGPYSPDPAMYEPKCVPCHRIADRSRSLVA